MSKRTASKRSTPSRTRAQRRSSPAPSRDATPDSFYSYREGAESDSTKDSDDASVKSLVGESLASVTSPVVSPNLGGRPVGSGTKTRSNSRSLAPWQQKLLAQDVEEFGGLAKICPPGTGKTKSRLKEFGDKFAQKDEERTELYGAHDSKKRDKLRNKLQYWRGLPQGEYYKIISDWNILPAAFANSPAVASKNPPPVGSKKPPPVGSKEPPNLVSPIACISSGLKTLTIDPSSTLKKALFESKKDMSSNTCK